MSDRYRRCVSAQQPRLFCKPEQLRLPFRD